MIATDAVMLTASVVMSNHTGLVEAVEKVTRYRFRVLSCAKCGTFWVVLIYLLFHNQPVIGSVAASFALSYTAIWLELFMGYLAKRYETLSNKIQAAPPDEGEAASKNDMPEV